MAVSSGSMGAHVGQTALRARLKKAPIAPPGRLRQPRFCNTAARAGAQGNLNSHEPSMEATRAGGRRFKFVMYLTDAAECRAVVSRGHHPPAQFFFAEHVTFTL